MSFAKDSSVLFALDELRCMEEERSAASARAARERAQRDRDRETEEKRRQQHSEQQSADLVALRALVQAEEAQRAELADRLAQEGARRRALEGQLQRLREQHEPVCGLAPSAPTRPHPALWTMALLGVGAILFWLIPRQAAPPPVVAESSPLEVEAAAANCPEPAPVEVSPPPPPPRRSLVEPVPADATRAPRGPRRIRQKTPPRPGAAASSLPVDCAGKGPLCGLPED